MARILFLSYPDPWFYDLPAALEADRERPYRVVRPLEFVPHSRSLAVRAVREHLTVLWLACRATRESVDPTLALRYTRARCM